MVELTINQLIKIILAVIVIVVVVVGVAMFFGNRIMDFFKNLPGGGSEFILSLL